MPDVPKIEAGVTETLISPRPAPPRYCVGIDLGTTNSVVTYAPLSTDRHHDGPPRMQRLAIPQIVAAGGVESLDHLPSFLYMPRSGEVASLTIPGEHYPDPAKGVAGRFARDQSADDPDRVIVAAKSWLCHPGVPRSEPALPWGSAENIPKLSAAAATEHLLRHLAAAWHQAHRDDPLEHQIVVLTVPASFDPAARELTRTAATAARLPDNLILLEEPQAAVYHYLATTGERWREQLREGDRLLVVDVGGGTTDLTLIDVRGVEGQLQLHRAAVGNHLLVGGDNMDLALAHLASTQMADDGHDLDPWAATSLWHACRQAKERLLDDDAAPQNVSVLGRGTSLIGGTISTTLQPDDVRSRLLDGFFPKVQLGDRPTAGSTTGFQDIGLPYESDPAITRQVSAFLSDHAAGGAVTHVLLNGGVFAAESIRRRFDEVAAGWFDPPPQRIGDVGDLSAAVASGACYYGYSQNRGGMRIRGGIPRSYYVGIETAGMAVPGMPRPMRAVCVAARGMEEGSAAEVPGPPVGAIVGQPAHFRFFSSTTRPDDSVGAALNRWPSEDLIESEPIELTLEGLEDQSAAGLVPVRFESRVTELGWFELWCHAEANPDAAQQPGPWKVTFNAREDH